MNYIIINDLYEKGGAEVQSKREFLYFKEHGHNVVYINIDPNLDYLESKMEGHINLAKRKNPIFRMLDRFTFDKDLYARLCKIIAEVQPDAIHLNNIYFSSEAVYRAVEDRFCFQTIRDFSLVCVKSTCMLDDCSVCKGIKHENCTKNCLPLNPKQLAVFVGRYLALRHNNKLRKECVNFFVSPSQCLADYSKDLGYDTVCINNPFDFRYVRGFEKEIKKDTKIYMYYGEVSEKKGIKQLVKAFCVFCENKNDVELHIVGRLKSLTEAEICKIPQIRYFGYMKYEDIINKLRGVYCVVVPSLWVENYPNTVLEGFATNCIVIGSDRGGIPEQLENKGFVFDILNTGQIIDRLEMVYALTNEERERIYQRQSDYLAAHNTQDVYYKKIMKLIEEKQNEMGC